MLDPAIRQMVTWSTANLAGNPPPLGIFDLVLMRNVLIYFGPEERAKILTRTAAQVASDGALLLGVSETTFGQCEQFEPRTYCGTTVYRKVEGAQSSRAPENGP